MHCGACTSDPVFRRNIVAFYDDLIGEHFLCPYPEKPKPDAHAGIVIPDDIRALADWAALAEAICRLPADQAGEGIRYLDEQRRAAAEKRDTQTCAGCSPEAWGMGKVKLWLTAARRETRLSA